ncbi:MAG: hypothetical protein OES38_10295 [Gammaproteobacteria bacterium]|nr:hypothetical protein [Gammaproteobacteria bacterium]
MKITGFSRLVDVSMRVFTMAAGGLMYQAAIAGQKYSFRSLQW